MIKWTPEMEAIAVGMKRAGIPAKAIAQRLGVSSNSVNLKTSRKKAYIHLDKKKSGLRKPPPYGERGLIPENLEDIS
jgi:transposase